MDYLVEGEGRSPVILLKLVNFATGLFIVATGKNQSFFLRFLFFLVWELWDAGVFMPISDDGI